MGQWITRQLKSSDERCQRNRLPSQVVGPQPYSYTIPIVPMVHMHDPPIWARARSPRRSRPIHELGSHSRFPNSHLYARPDAISGGKSKAKVGNKVGQSRKALRNIKPNYTILNITKIEPIHKLKHKLNIKLKLKSVRKLCCIISNSLFYKMYKL